MLKNELKRALTSKGMMLSLLVGMGICAAYGIELTLAASRRYSNISSLGLYEPLTTLVPFDAWFACEITKYYFYFYYMLPIFATLPFAVSYAKEKTSGYTKNILCRTSAGKYALSKYTAVFVAGGTAVTVPLVLNLLWVFTIVPYQKPMPGGNQHVATGITALGEFYYFHPFIYCFLYLVLTFVLSGGIASLALVISLYTQNFFTVLLMPFIVNMLLESVVTMDYSSYLPLKFISPMLSGSKFVYGCIVCLVIIVVSGYIYIKGVEKRDYL